MTREELLQLPAAVDVRTAGEVLGVGRTAAYALIRNGNWPTPVLHLGPTIRVPTAPLLRLLEVEPDAESQLQLAADA
jgi:hypothetical protein